MERLHFKIHVDCPASHLWQVMLEKDSYQAWTTAFMPGSTYEGDWRQGSKIKFIGPDGAEGTSGMLSRIRESKPHSYISIEHMGVIENGKEITSGKSAEAWAGALENYHFNETTKGTELIIETDTVAEYREMFEESWPVALDLLKQIAEKSYQKV